MMTGVVEERRTVLLVDDHPVVRAGMRALIQREKKLTVSNEADNRTEARALALQQQPDVAVVDISLKHSNGLELIKDFRARGWTFPSLVISMHAEEIYACAAHDAGAQGFVSKTATEKHLVPAIWKVLGGELAFSGGVQARLQGRPAGGGLGSLSVRELEVFSLVGQALDNDKIAAHLGVAQSTVENIKCRIKEKLGIETTTQLIAFAVRHSMDRG
jgi:DNA-binding NarL/FixJ family response regulator